LGMVLLRLDKAAEAEAELRTALAIDQTLADENPAVANFARNLAFFHLSLGDLLTQTRRESQGVAECRAARAILQRLSDQDPGNTDLQGLLWHTHSASGRALSYTGRLAEAEAELRAGLVILEKHPGGGWSNRYRLAVGLVDLGDVVRSMGRAVEA